MPAFSINIIVKNGAKTLNTCLESLKGLSDDTVVIVDRSTTDNTKDIVKKFNCRFLHHTFTDFSSQRNFALSESKHSWVFSLDADEYISPELNKYLREFKAHPNPLEKAFTIKRLNIIFGKIIRHSNWDPNGIIRLFDRGSGIWAGEIHETWVSTGPISRINLPIIHQNYQTVEEFLTKLNSYTSAEAKQISDFNYFKFFWVPLKEFIRRFVLHAGFLDGFHGLFLSYLMWFYQISIWVKVWQKQHIVS